VASAATRCVLGLLVHPKCICGICGQSSAVEACSASWDP